MTQPLVYIEPPDVDPHRFGLFGAAQPLTGVDEHWLYGGVEFESLACYEAAFYPMGVGMDGGAGGSKTLPDGAGTTTAHPFTVYAGILCGSVGYTADQYRARALRVLELSGQSAAETALWTGAGGNLPGLNGTGYAQTPNGSTAVSIVDALGILEDWLGQNYNGSGVIHATRRTVVKAASQRLVRHDPDTPVDLLMTPVGSRWIGGAGYDGTGPAAVAPGTGNAWMYATGQIMLARDDPETPADMGEALDRSLNLVRLIAEQSYLIAVDCAAAAVKVNLSL